MVLGLAAQTNIASALMIDPTIAGRIDLWLLGTSLDFERGLWGKLDFNCMMDVRAMDWVLGCAGLSTTILPVNVAEAFIFTRDELGRRLDLSVPVNEYLLHRWYTHVDGGRLQRVLWDLALVELLLHPELGRFVQATTPAENRARPVRVVREIDVAGMKEDFFSSCAKWLRPPGASGPR